MKVSHILLIGNGEAVSARLLKQLARRADLIIAADGGAGQALKAGLTPDFVAGDLDSISKRARRLLHDRILNMVSQDNTDLEKALFYVTHAFPEATELTFVGFVGDRWDFSIGNILHVACYAANQTITFAGDGWRMNLLTRGAAFATKSRKRVSLVPLKPCSGVTLTGLKYPLADESLAVGTTRSLSNQTTGRSFRVSFTRGLLLVYREV